MLTFDIFVYTCGDVQDGRNLYLKLVWYLMYWTGMISDILNWYDIWYFELVWYLIHIYSLF